MKTEKLSLRQVNISIFIGVLLSYKLILSILNLVIQVQQDAYLMKKVDFLTDYLLVSAPIVFYLPFISVLMLLLVPILFKSKRIRKFAWIFSALSLFSLYVVLRLLCGDILSNFSAIILIIYCIYSVLFLSILGKHALGNLFLNIHQKGSE